MKQNPTAVFNEDISFKISNFRDPEAENIPVEFKTTIMKVVVNLGSESCL